jgi:sigma-E factor negative regulatory protein RseC
MSVREAIVLEVSDGRALLKVGAEAGCGRCDSVGGCRSGVLGELFGKRCTTYRVATVPGLREGSTVQVSLPPHGVLLAAACAYGLPLAGIFAGAGLAESLQWNDALSACAAFAGAAIGFAAGVVVARQRKASRALAIRILDRGARGASQ